MNIPLKSPFGTSVPYLMVFTMLFSVNSSLAIEKTSDSEKKSTSATDVSLPRDASRVVDRSASCFHFSGEFNGDGSQRDKEVTATMKELRCDHIERDVLVIRKKYRQNQAVQTALDSATEL